MRKTAQEAADDVQPPTVTWRPYKFVLAKRPDEVSPQLRSGECLSVVYISLSVCLSVCLSVYTVVCLCLCVCVYVSISIYVCLSLFLVLNLG